MSDDIATPPPPADQAPLLSPQAETLARQAVADLHADGAGDLLGVHLEDNGSTTYRFSAHLRGYRGWEWQVVLSGDADRPTVDELALMPGDDALLSPAWVPWEDRLQPGDLSDGDVLPVAEDDPRLVPGYIDSGDDELDDAAMPIGYGRERVLSQQGRDEAATRWAQGDYGPDTTRAKRAPARCETCGFYLPLAGALKASFGVCANRLSADGHVVHARYGCGAHSSVKEDFSAARPADMYFDDAEFELVTAPASEQTGGRKKKRGKVTEPHDTAADESGEK